MRKQYIRWFYPGAFVSDTVDLELQPDQPITPPERAFGFQTFSREEVELDGEVLKGKPKDFSPMTYYGKAYTLEEVRRLPDVTKILIQNMTINGWPRIVRTSKGRLYPLNKGDVVLEPTECEPKP